MKKVAVIAAVSSVLGLGLALDGSAQTRPTAPADRPSSDQPRTSAPRETFKNTMGLHESSAIIGTRVKSPEGKDLGEIDQLLIDPKAGKITHAVIGVGGLVGIGEKHVVVPWSEVKMTTDQTARDRTVIAMDQATLERAPRYEKRAAADRDRSAPSASPRGPSDRPSSTTDRPAGSPSGTTR
jgi:sporulation protein YlmC with PRC-barrel domain